MKVSMSEYRDFIVEFDKNTKYAKQRFGQAFVNTYLRNSVVDSDLFYCVDRYIADSLIWSNYVDLESI